MTKSLIIAAPIANATAVNTKLEQLGYGPNNLSVRMLGDQVIQPALNETPDFSAATHLGCHWYADDETIAAIDAIRNTDLASCTINHQEVAQNPVGLFNATVGDNVTITHKLFNGTQWGWRAEMKVASPDFNPGVRAIAIYTDANHANFSYTTGAFVNSNGVWATEWNDGRANKAAVHWAVLFASQKEVVGTLAASADRSVAFMRYGLPPASSPTVQPWVQPLGAFDAYALGAQVTHNGFTWQSTVPANVWEPGVVQGLWVQI